LSEAASLGEEMNELQRISPARWGLAEVALRQGDHAAALGWCELGFAASARVHDAAYLFPYVVTGTRAHLAAQNPTGARSWLDRTSALLRERNIPGTLGAIDHAAGLIHLHEGLTGKARDALARAAAAWSSRRRFWEGTQVLLDQARCAHRSRRPADAAAFGASASALMAAAGVVVPAGTSGAMPAGPVGPALPAGSSQVVAPAQPALSSLSAVPVVSVLSAREMEVARLVATGATNREIASALSIAPKTVAAHIEHILAKLGVSRRAQIATWTAMH
jgi:DNA-binding CsgD family transcriptional regulator